MSACACADRAVQLVLGAALHEKARKSVDPVYIAMYDEGPEAKFGANNVL